MKKIVKSADDADPNAGMFFTDPEVSRRMVKWAGVTPRMIVCEPSAGDGSIVRALLEAGVRNLTAVEIRAELAKSVKSLVTAHLFNQPQAIKAECNYRVFHADFLKWSASRAADPEGYRADLAIGNPPYENNSDTRHVSAMLDIAKRVIVLVRANFEHGSNPRVDSVTGIRGRGRHEMVFSKGHVTRRVVLVKRPKFYGPGNKGDSAQSDYAILEITRGSHIIGFDGRVHTERWLID